MSELDMLTLDPEYDRDIFADPPAFLMAMSDLWKAWTQMQARGDTGSMHGEGWALTGGEVGDGRFAMTVSIFFSPQVTP